MKIRANTTRARATSAASAATAGNRCPSRMFGRQEADLAQRRHAPGCARPTATASKGSASASASSEATTDCGATRSNTRPAWKGTGMR